MQQIGGTPQINGILTVINVATAESSQNSTAIVATVDAGCSPVRMAETADLSTLWVAARGDNRVLAFSTGMLEQNTGNALVGYVATGGAAPVRNFVVRQRKTSCRGELEPVWWWYSECDGVVSGNAGVGKYCTDGEHGAVSARGIYRAGWEDSVLDELQLKLAAGDHDDSAVEGWIW